MRTATTATPPRPPRRPRAGRRRPGGIYAGRLTVAAAALVLTLAACGSDDDKDPVASAGTPTAKPTGGASPGTGPGNEREGLLRFSQCMRENGVPNFPDPDFAEGGGVNLSAPDGADPARMREAEGKCKQFMPNAGENKPVDPQIAKRNRELAKCMRENGVPNFPDPEPDGTLQIQASPGAGLDPGNPAFEAASKKCEMTPPGGGATLNGKP